MESEDEKRSKIADVVKALDSELDPIEQKKWIDSLVTALEAVDRHPDPKMKHTSMTDILAVTMPKKKLGKVPLSILSSIMF